MRCTKSRFLGHQPSIFRCHGPSNFTNSSFSVQPLRLASNLLNLRPLLIILSICPAYRLGSMTTFPHLVKDSCGSCALKPAASGPRRGARARERSRGGGSSPLAPRAPAPARQCGRELQRWRKELQATRGGRLGGRNSKWLRVRFGVDSVSRKTLNVQRFFRRPKRIKGVVHQMTRILQLAPAEVTMVAILEL